MGSEAVDRPQDFQKFGKDHGGRSPDFVRAEGVKRNLAGTDVEGPGFGAQVILVEKMFQRGFDDFVDLPGLGDECRRDLGQGDEGIDAIPARGDIKRGQGSKQADVSGNDADFLPGLANRRFGRSFDVLDMAPWEGDLAFVMDDRQRSPDKDEVGFSSARVDQGENGSMEAIVPGFGVCFLAGRRRVGHHPELGRKARKRISEPVFEVMKGRPHESILYNKQGVSGRTFPAPFAFIMIDGGVRAILPSLIAFKEILMSIICLKRKKGLLAGVMAGFLLAAGAGSAFGQSVDIPSKRWGISFGNSKEFTGLRFNFRDRDTVRITGVNITLWTPRKGFEDRENENSVVTGLSLGLVPSAGTLTGVQIGLLGAGGIKNVVGITGGLLGAGSGGNMTGLSFGGLGVGAGGDLTGINIGGLGAGAGKNLIGINIGGLGIGAGENVTGISFGGLGLGAGGRLTGINIGGVGVGAGERLAGLTFAGIGAGSKSVRGLTIAGIAVGGEDVRGLSLAGIAVGGEHVGGLAVGGIAVGGKQMSGVFLAGAFTKIVEDGRLRGVVASPFNHLKGTVTGLSLGIVNYAYRIEKGIQIGLVNIVRENKPGLRVLPVFNADFR